MADEEAIRPSYAVFPNSALGGYATPTPVLPERTWGEAFTDTARDLGAGTVGAARGIAGVGEAVRSAIDTAPPTGQRQRMDALSDLESYIRTGRSERSKYLDEHGGPSPFREPGTYAAHVTTEIAPYIPLAAVGPWAGAAGAGAIAYGQAAADERESIRQATPQQLLNHPRFRELFQSGVTFEEAREQFSQEITDPSKMDTNLRRSPAAAGNALGFGAVLRGSKALLRGDANAMVDRIMSKAGALKFGIAGGAAEATAGALAGMGSDYSRQAGEVAAGLKPEINYGDVAHAGVEPGVLTGGLGFAGHARARQKEIRAREAAKIAPPIGTELEAVARQQAGEVPQTDWRTRVKEPPRGDGDLAERPMLPGEEPSQDYVREPQPFTPPRAPPPPIENEPAGYGTPERPLAPAFPEMERPGRGGYDIYLDEQEPLPPAVPPPAPPPAPRGGGGPPPPTFTPDTPPGSKGKRALAASRRSGTFGDVETPEQLARGQNLGEIPSREGELPTAPDPPFRVRQPEQVARDEQAARDEAAVAEAGRALADEARERLARTAEEEPGLGAPAKGEAPSFTEIEKPGKPAVEDFGEQPEAKLPWRNRDAIEKALLDRDATTRNQWANRLQRMIDKGEPPTLDVLPVLGQRMLSKIREEIDRMMADHPQGTVDAIRGRHTEEVPGTQLEPRHKTALDDLKSALLDAEHQHLKNTLYDAVTNKKVKKLLWNMLPKSTRDALDHVLSKEAKSAVVDAVREHLHETVDYIHGHERAPEPKQYRYKGEETEAVRSERLETGARAKEPPTALVDDKPETKAAPREKTVEELFEDAAEHMPKEPAHPRSLEDLLGLQETKPQLSIPHLIRRQVTENIEKAKTGLGTLYHSLSDQGKRVLDDMARRLSKDINAEVPVATHFDRALALALNSENKDFNTWQRKKWARQEKEAKRTAERKRHDGKEREDIVRRILTNPNLSIDTLANAYTLDPVTGKMYHPKGEKPAVHADAELTVRQMFEQMLDLHYHAKQKDSGETSILFNNVPSHTIREAAKRFIDLGNARLYEAEKQMGEARDIMKSSQITWDLPKKRGGQWQWYDVLADIQRMTRTMEMFRAKGGDARLASVMLNFYITERAIQMGRPDHLEKFRQEKTVGDYNRIKTKVAGLSNRISQLEDWAGTIRRVEKRFTGDAKVTLSKSEAEAYQTAKQGFGERQQAELPIRTNELTKLQKQLDEMDYMSGLDPYMVEKEHSPLTDMEGKLIEALDDERALHASDQLSINFIIEHLLEPNEEQQIQMLRKAREEGRVNTAEQLAPANKPPPTKGDEFIQKVNPEKATKRITDLSNEMEKLDAAMDAVPDDITGRVKETVDTLHAALASDGKERSKAVTNENAAALRKEISERAKKIEDEQRKLAEDAVPEMLTKEYGINRVLDSSADLSIRTNLPVGAYAKRVSDFINGRRNAAGAQMSIRPTGKMNYDVALNHMLDVANKVVGDTEIVALTSEQMGLAAQKRDLPADTPAFYDPKAHRIFIRQDVLHSDRGAAVLGHEIAHPLTEVAIQHFPEIGRRLDAIRLEMQKEWMKPYSKVGDAMGMHYNALQNVHEFLAEFFNDGGRLRTALGLMDLPEPMAEGLKTSQRASFLQKVFKAINDGIYKMLMRQTHKSALSHTIVQSLDLFQGISAKQERTKDFLRPKFEEGMAARPSPGTEQFASWAKEQVDRAKTNWDRLDGRAGALLQTHDLGQMSRRAEPGMQGHVVKIKEAMAKSFSSFKRILDDRGVERIAHEINDVMRLNPHMAARFQDYIDLENHAGVSGSEPLGVGRNKWVSLTAPEHAQYRDMHAELAAKWATLPQRAQLLRSRLLDFYSKSHAEMADALVGQLVDLRKMLPTGSKAAREALVKFVHGGEMTDAEKTLLKAEVPGFTPEIDRNNKTPEYTKFRQQLRDIRALPGLRKVPGTWYPAMRRGDWVVESVFKLDRHGKAHGGVEESRGVWDFKSAAERRAFMDDMAGDAVLKQVKFLDMEDIKADPDEPGSVPLFRAKYNPLSLEFFEKQHEAFDRHAALKKQFKPDDLDLTHVEPRRAEESTYLNPSHSDRALQAVLKGLQNSEGWRDLDATTQRQMERDLKEAVIRHTMSMSARATYLPKNYALGARKDVMRDFLDYSTNTSYSLAELRHRNELSASYKSMDDYVESMKHAGAAGDPQGRYGILRRQLQQSLHRRADYRPDPVLTPMWSKALSRVLQLSYLDKLMSPAQWVLNGLEIAMTGAPLLAGEHGIKAYGHLMRAYSDLGFAHLEGMSDAAIVAKAGVGGIPQLPDNPKRFKEATKHLPDAAAIHKMIDHFEMLGHLDRDSSMEVSRIVDPAAGTVLRHVDYVDNISRQISAQIDNANKVVLGIAALRMATEQGRGGGRSFEAALAHAEKYVDKTVGNYAKYNEPEMFRHKLLGPALQFKRYAQRQTGNWLGMLYHAAWFGDVTPEQRSIARRQLAYASGTLMLVSGALGMPTEPIKGVINAFRPITGFDSDDAENWVRQRAADVFGKDLGAIVTRGVPRYFNIGLGTRLGLDSLWTHGAPSDKPGDWWATFGHLMAGAPGAYVADAVEGLGRVGSAAGNGLRGYSGEALNDLRQGAQLLIPSKILTDVIGAAANYYGGPGTRTRFNQPLGYQPSLPETLLGAAGIASGRSQEIGDQRRAVRADLVEATEQRAKLYATYVHAGSRSEKTAIWQDIQSGYNQRVKPEERIKFQDLMHAETRWAKRLEDPAQLGMTMTRKQRSLLPNYGAYLTQ